MPANTPAAARGDAQKVPFHLDDATVLWIPSPLLPALQQLWRSRPNATTDPAPTAVDLWCDLVAVLSSPAKTLSEGSRLSLLRLSLESLSATFADDDDIHRALATHPEPHRIIRIWFEANEQISSPLRARRTPHLVTLARAGDTKLHAIFGGQGADYFAELLELFNTYPQVRSFVDILSQELCDCVSSPHAKTADESGLFRQGLDVAAWLANPAAVPAKAYLASAPISYPLIGLVQLTQYLVVLKLWDVRPAEAASKLFSSFAGHSQGILSAVVAASSKSWDDFTANAKLGVRTLFWTGLRAQQCTIFPALRHEIVRESENNGDGRPSPMLAIYHLSPADVEGYVARINKALADESSLRRIEVGLINGPRAVVVCGHPHSLHLLAIMLRQKEAPSDDQAAAGQARIPFSKRKKRFSMQYLPVTAPFHASFLDRIVDLVARDAQRDGLAFPARALQGPVYSTFDGADLRSIAKNDKIKDLLPLLVSLQTCRRVDWPACTRQMCIDSPAHIVDFGPGRRGGAGALLARNVQGAGVQVVAAGAFARPQATPRAALLADKATLYTPLPEGVAHAVHWGRDHAPTLVRRRVDGRVFVSTAFTRLTGKPPIMVAGMTPTTVCTDLVNAVQDAGYFAELAGGGLSTPERFRSHVEDVADKSGAVCLNLLYLNARQWSMQLPMIERMTAEGIPILGVTVAAGVPSPDKAKEILDTLADSGVRFVAFKPGNIEAILTVCEVAERTDQKIILQWTGGRGGGHHSMEDFHQPILETYARIRACGNIVLVAGSGFGAADASDTFPYITGEWSRKLGFAAMPFDAVLLASRVMVAREAATAPEVKKLLCETPGVEDALWERSIGGSAGGIMTVRSELGEPIHKVANRGIRFWAELDKDLFSIKDARERGAAIAAKKAHIIQRLNDDFQKPYFGELTEMTYDDVLRRMVALMYVRDSAASAAAKKDVFQWLDAGFRSRVHLFALRTEERLSTGTDVRESALPSVALLDTDPSAFLDAVLEAYPAASTQVLAAEDVDHFVDLCRRRGIKPVNFVPLIDHELEYWFKKDSLWYSETLDAVGRDVGRVCILQGPVSVAHSKTPDEPVADILNGIHDAMVDRLRAAAPNAPMSSVECIGGAPLRAVSYEQVRASCADGSEFRAEEYTVVRGASEKATKGSRATAATSSETDVHWVVQLPSSEANLPDAELYFEWMAGPQHSWWRSLLTSSHILQGTRQIGNVFKRVFRPRPSQRVELHYRPGDPVFGRSKACFFDGPDTTEPSMVARWDGKSDLVVTLYHQCPGAGSVAVDFKYTFHAEHGFAPVREVVDGRTERIKRFYGQLWGCTGSAFAEAFDLLPTDFHLRASVTPTQAEIDAFRRATGQDKGQSAHGPRAPMDFGIVVAWEPLVKALFPKRIDGDLLNLVHLSNAFTRLADADIEAGKALDVAMEIVEVDNLSASVLGKRVTVEGTIAPAETPGQPILRVKSQFLFRGAFTDDDTHTRVRETRIIKLAGSEQRLAVLMSKPWFEWTTKPTASDDIVLELDTSETPDAVSTTGRILRRSARGNSAIGSVEHKGAGGNGNPLRAFVMRESEQENPAVFFATGGYRMATRADVVRAPDSNVAYALASGDLNPIHTSPYFSDMAGLPSTICHGMWTSANARRVVEAVVAPNEPTRIHAYSAEFKDMVNPGEAIATSVKHVGVRAGRMVLEVVTKTKVGGRTVLQGSAEVDAPRTAYVFTGQGSAEPKMGMQLYESSAVARAAWDEADAYFSNQFGLSLLDVVRRNPKSVTVHFGGARGEKIRSNFMSLGKGLFPSIDESTQSFTFQHPEGLLYATQFTQPALVMMELAAFRDMAACSLVPAGSVFAGHSLGEYSCLSAVANVLPLASLMKIVFLRGMSMQSAVKRTRAGRSRYGMAAVNPSRVGKGFREGDLQKVVAAVAEASDDLLQIVNFNVRDQQYVAAGVLTNLYALEFVLARVREAGGSLEGLDEVAQAGVDEALDQADADGIIRLRRGTSTIPLPGIDVPFHSRFLKEGVPAFRDVLRRSFDAAGAHVNLDQLTGQYIPNLTAEPFEVTRDYVAMTHKLTDSSVLAEILAQDWDSLSVQEVGVALLIELLAFQFASPVRWIETQHQMFAKMHVQRLIEVGPAPTLFTMARRTLALGQYSPLVSRELLFYNRDRASIYYEHEDEAEEDDDADDDEEQGAAPAAAPAAPATPAAAPAAPAPAPVAAAPVPVAAAAGPVADAPVSALEFVQVLLAIRLKKPIDQLPGSAQLKALVGGKSALQNEIVGELEKELGGSPPENGDITLEALAQQMGSKYAKLGKVGTAMTHKWVSSKMPGGFGMSQVRGYLSTTYGLGEGRSQGVLLQACMMDAEGGARAASEAAAQQRLDEIVAAYAGRTGVAIGKASAAPAAAAPMAFAAPAAGGGGGGAPAPVPDAPVRAIDFLQIYLATKLKKPLDAVPESTSIKDLVGGKSAMQNEILGDLGTEFGGADVEGAGEKPLGQLASAMGASYAKLGKLGTRMVSKMVTSKLAGMTVSSTKTHLEQVYGVGAGRAEGIMLHGLLDEPAARHASETDSHGWLAKVVSAYAARQGVQISPGGSGSGGGGAASAAAGGAMMDPAVLKQLRSDQDKLAHRQIAALHEFLGEDPETDMRRLRAQEAQMRSEAENQLAMLSAEHGEAYLAGIRPRFDPAKERVFDSYWNWTRQDVLQLYYDKATNRATRWGPDIRERLYHIKNRAVPEICDMVRHHIDISRQGGVGELAFAEILLRTLEEVIDDQPKYREMGAPTAPSVGVRDDGSIEYKEVPRDGVPDMVAYVEELRLGGARGLAAMEAASARARSDADPVGWAAIKAALKAQELPAKMIASVRAQLQGREREAAAEAASKAPDVDPLVFIRSRSSEDGTHRVLDKELTDLFLRTLSSVAGKGVTFVGKSALVTGCGRGSIGVEIVKALLRGGATVVATTSRFSRQGADFYRSLYDNFGAKGSKLIVVPFNQASTQDVDSLVDYVMGTKGLDLDYVVPFAAIPENGNDISSIDDRSELAHRIMLTNTVRLLGKVRAKKAELSVNRPAQCLLPLSPNHGQFGFDGLYAESKLGLEALLLKWKAEGWSDQLSLAGAVIGWTRGTGLMSANNLVAPGIEGQALVRTFSSAEMAFNLMGLLHPDVVRAAQHQPLLADLTGGLYRIEDLNGLTNTLRGKLLQEAAIRKAVARDLALDETEGEGPGANGASARPSARRPMVTPRANIGVEMPALPSAERRQRLKHLEGMVDLRQTVVVVGFGEVGPLGSARTRWQMEAYGEFSLEGCIELAWVMGFIRYERGKGWVDCASGESVRDLEIKEQYEERILAHTGIRIVEPELFDDYDPERKMFLHTVALNHDLEPIEVSEEEGAAFVKQHGEGVDVYERDGVTYAAFRKGAQLYIPKALRHDRFVAGQIPTGWDAKTYGIPDDIVSQVDPVTLFSLVAVVEALVSAGVRDPYEFYQYVHVSEVGNTLGGGLGGQKSLRATHRHRMMDKTLPADVLQEEFINTVPAWINMLLLSSSGPIRTPVGACATAVESVDIGVDAIQRGAARVCVVGGYDDIQEESMYEFAQIKATSNAEKEVAAGREPSEMSRPTSSSRGGFMESQGSGVEILMDAELAVAMGVPIFGIVALTSTATDREGRSVPAPGQGILTTCRERKTATPNPMMDITYRRKRLMRTLDRVRAEADEERAELGENPDEEQLARIAREQQQQEAMAYRMWSNNFYQGDPTIAPVRGALAVWGLTVDDLGVASFHGTGTKANDVNESRVLHTQLAHLGRAKGNVILSIFQKSLTGHPKGAAGAWMLNGLLQSVCSGLVPGNRNADNIDPVLRDFEFLAFLNRSLQTSGLEAGILKSFGFGQVGAEVIVVHPDYLLAVLSDAEFEAYATKRAKRERAAYQHWQAALCGKAPFVAVKNDAPYSESAQNSVYLDPLARAQYDARAGTWRFAGSEPVRRPRTESSGTGSRAGTPGPPVGAPRKEGAGVGAGTRIEVMLRTNAEKQRLPTDKGIGVDCQAIAEIDVAMQNRGSGFLTRNFTDSESQYCAGAPDPAASFAGRWAAKEAVIKALSSADASGSGSLWKGAGAPLRDIEVVRGPSGAPEVVLHGHAQQVAVAVGVSEIKVTISHSGEYAVAQAVAR